MKQYKTAAIIALIISASGCSTTYTVVSTTATLATGNDIAGHTISRLTDTDCRTGNVVKGRYYCEYSTDPGRTYNRNGF
jgi:metal-dependent amidase/aminoacylase/carboxypeptidase family protein